MGRLAAAPVVYTLLGVNILVFLLWGWPGVPRAFMAENFLVSWPHLAQGRVWVVVTSVLSHTLLVHLLVNMVVLVSFGVPMERLLGSLRFTVLFFVAGVAVTRFLDHRNTAPYPYIWTKTVREIIEKIDRGLETLETLHWLPTRASGPRWSRSDGPCPPIPFRTRKAFEIPIPYETLDEMQVHLDLYLESYNTQRPHRIQAA